MHPNDILKALSRFRRKIDELCRQAFTSASGTSHVGLCLSTQRPIVCWNDSLRFAKGANCYSASSTRYRAENDMSFPAQTGGSTTTRMRARGKYNPRTMLQAHYAPVKCPERDRFTPSKNFLPRQKKNAITLRTLSASLRDSFTASPEFPATVPSQRHALQ